MGSKFLRYNPKLKKVARMLRKNSTLAEILLWNEPKGKQMPGYDFHRKNRLVNTSLIFSANS